MDPADTTTTRDAERREVDPSEIERELLRAWRDAAQDEVALPPNGDAPAARVRATLANFVILTSEGEADCSGAIDELISSLCANHPSRFFTLRLGDELASPGISPLRAAVSSRCVVARSGRRVCSEEVSLSFTASGARSVPNLLLSLFTADVPVVLLVRADVFHTAGDSVLRDLFLKLASLAQIVLYDSQGYSDYHSSVAAMFQLIGAEDQRGQWSPRATPLRLRDLNWYRSERWRLLIAEQFDSERFRRGVKSVRSLTLSCRALSPEDLPSKACLLSGWFCDALDWEPTRAERMTELSIRVFCRRKNLEGEGVLEFACDGIVPAHSDSVAAIAISLLNEEQNLTLKIERDLREERATIAVESPDQHYTESCSFCDFSLVRVPFRRATLEELLMRPLNSGGVEEHFFRSIARSLRISRFFETVGARKK